MGDALRARDVAAEAARSALIASGVADEKSLEATGNLAKASEGMLRAKDAYGVAQEDQYKQSRETPSP